MISSYDRPLFTTADRISSFLMASRLSNSSFRFALLPGHTFSSLRSHQPLLFQSFLPMLPYLFFLFLPSLFSFLILLFSVPYSVLMQSILYYSHPVQRLSILLSALLLQHDPAGIYYPSGVSFQSSQVP